MTIDFSILDVSNELERVRAIEALCQIGIVLTKDQPNLFQIQEIFAMISYLNIAILPVTADSLKPMIRRMEIED